MDCLSATERAWRHHRAGRRRGANALDRQHHDLLHWLAPWIDQLHHDGDRDARAWNDAFAPSADGVVMVHYGCYCAACLQRAAGWGADDFARPFVWHELFRSGGACCKRSISNARGRLATPVAARFLVFWPPGGLHRDTAGDGAYVAGAERVFA